MGDYFLCTYLKMAFARIELSQTGKVISMCVKSSPDVPTLFNGCNSMFDDLESDEHPRRDEHEIGSRA